jgi:hypothetical protein
MNVYTKIIFKKTTYTPIYHYLYVHPGITEVEYNESLYKVIFKQTTYTTIYHYLYVHPGINEVEYNESLYKVILKKTTDIWVLLSLF